MRLTIKHFYDFHNAVDREGDLNPSSWDALRLDNSASDNVFAIPASAGIWRDRILANATLHKRVEAILDLIAGRFSQLYSYGIGTAGLEFLIKKMAPHIFLECSDYAPKTVERLKGFFKEADKIVQFDSN